MDIEVVRCSTTRITDTGVRSSATAAGRLTNETRPASCILYRSNIKW